MMLRKELTEMLTKRLTDKYKIGQAITFTSKITGGEPVTGNIVEIAHPYLTVFVPQAQREFLVYDFEIKETHENT